ncbi:MAG: DUF1700 domain-containing protein [Lachnospiraceae bacterium]|nr:DUF1700 domain-containing protein [Lachnospiraceae bacterium]
MNKDDFLRELAAELSDLSEKDRDDAIKYYSDYIDDAGYDAETVIAELGTPGAVAATVRSESPVIRETADIPNPPANPEIVNPIPVIKQNKAERRLPAWVIVVLTLLSPVLLALALVSLVIVILLVLLILAIPLLLAALTLGSIAGGMTLLIAGITITPHYAPPGFFSMAVALGLVGFGCIFLILTCICFTRILPGLFGLFFSGKKKVKKEGGME